MPEEGVMFNSWPNPPPEYLMRRSYNPSDVAIPGAVVREHICPVCGEVYPAWRSLPHHHGSPLCTKHGEGVHPALDVYAVDVPLVKENGERWT